MSAPSGARMHHAEACPAAAKTAHDQSFVTYRAAWWTTASREKRTTRARAYSAPRPEVLAATLRWCLKAPWPRRVQHRRSTTTADSTSTPASSDSAAWAQPPTSGIEERQAANWAPWPTWTPAPEDQPHRAALKLETSTLQRDGRGIS